jgi:hypothetical protein
MSWSATCVPDAVKMVRPFQVVWTSGRPRMDKVPTSPPARLVTWMPVTRCSASTTLLSGSLPMSSATTDSTTWSLVRLIARLLISDALTPVTTTVEVDGLRLVGGLRPHRGAAEQPGAGQSEDAQFQLKWGKGRVPTTLRGTILHVVS